MLKRVEHHRFLILCFIVIILIFLPPYTSSNFDIKSILEINSFILTNSIKNNYAFLFPYFNLISLLILLGTFFLGKIFNKPFSIFVSFVYFASAVLQNISVSDRYGFAVNSSTLLLSLLVAGSWGYELFSNQNDFKIMPHPKRLIVLIPVALLALWQPLNPSSLSLDFKPEYFLTSGSSLTFCMMTIVSISVLLAYYPSVNKNTLAITSLVGFLIGIGNMWLEFIYLPDLFWVGILHMPLVVISLIGISFSFKFWESVPVN